MKAVANSEHVETLKRGVYIWNQWRERNPDVRPDLRSAYLREANLERYNLADADLRGAVLLGASVRKARLEGADLAFADLRFVEHKGASMAGAKLRDAKGVTDELGRAVRPPTRWGRRLAAVLLALLLVSAVGYAYQDVSKWVELAFDGISAWNGPGGDSGDAPAYDEPYPPSLISARAAPLGSDRAVRELESAIAELRLPGWSLLRVQVQATVLDLRIDSETIEHELYVPTLAAACGAVVSHHLENALSEIRILNRTGEHGWAFQSPRGCEVLIESPPTVLRMVAASDSIELHKPLPIPDR